MMIIMMMTVTSLFRFNSHRHDFMLFTNLSLSMNSTLFMLRFKLLVNFPVFEHNIKIK